MRKKTVARSGRLLRPVLASAIAAASVPALAADTAALSILGFSRDQGVFAFEEYGIQDGSGFPYSNIYAIDRKSVV
jgi:predicted secreted protein